MRHSFVSYRLATQNALESGDDQAVSFAHYQELKPKDAERYFNIRPAGGEAEGKV